MNIWEADKLILFIAFVIPGFITLKAFELFFPTQEKDGSKQIIDAIAYSCINYALLSWAIYLIGKSELSENNPVCYSIFWLFVFFIAPVLWAWLWKKLRETQAFQNTMPHPTGEAWDYFFGKREPCFVIVRLTNGQDIAGFYGAKSFASSAPHAKQIYLQECWKMNSDGGFDRPRRQTKGVMILSSQVESLEFFKIEGENNDKEK